MLKDLNNSSAATRCLQLSWHPQAEDSGVPANARQKQRGMIDTKKITVDFGI